MNTQTESLPSSTGSAAADVIRVQPYITFNGRTEEALAYYRGVLGAETLFLMRFSECPTPMPPDAKVNPDHVLHACFRVGESTLLASDCACESAEQPKVAEGIALSIQYGDAKVARRIYQALVDSGAVVRQPLMETFFAAAFGVVTDRFGISWMIVGEPKE